MMIIFNVVGPFFIQDVLGYSPIVFGNIAFLLGCMAFLGILTNRILIQHVEVAKLIDVGIYGTLILCILQTILAFIFPLNLYSFTVPVGLIFFFGGFVVSNTTSTSLDFIDHGKGTASGIFAVILITTTGFFTALASLLQSDTIIPFALGFLVMILFTLIPYFFLFKKGLKKP